MFYLIKLVIFILCCIYHIHLYAETTAAKMINHYQVTQSYFLSLKEKVIIGNTLEEICKAVDLPPSTVPGGYWCGSLAHPKYVGRFLICSDGSIKVAGREACENPAIPTCPDGSWTLDLKYNLCSRPDFSCLPNTDAVSEEKLVAAIAYGESSNLDDFEEMAGIANAIIRRRDAAHSSSVNKLVKQHPHFSYAISDGNERYRNLMCEEESEYYFTMAYLASDNALNYGIDYANGGCFWDGYDLKSKGKGAYRYRQGFRYSDPSHNIFSTPEPPRKMRAGANGTYFNAYDSTAAHGKTIFWKLTEKFLKAQGAKQCR